MYSRIHLYTKQGIKREGRALDEPFFAQIEGKLTARERRDNETKAHLYRNHSVITMVTPAVGPINADRLYLVQRQKQNGRKTPHSSAHTERSAVERDQERVVLNLSLLMCCCCCFLDNRGTRPQGGGGVGGWGERGSTARA